MNFERFSAIANLTILIGGAGWAWWDWLPTYQNQVATLEQIKLNLDVDRQIPLDYQGRLAVTALKSFSDGSKLYDVTYTVDNKNLSKTQVAVSYSLAELYLGKTDGAEPASGEALAINEPPDPWHAEAGGFVRWKRVANEASLIDGDSNRDVRDWLHAHFASLNHVGLTAVMPSGTSNRYMPEFVIRAMPKQYVAVVVAFGIDDTLDIKSPDVGLVFDTQLLPDEAKNEEAGHEPGDARGVLAADGRTSDSAKLAGAPHRPIKNASE